VGVRAATYLFAVSIVPIGLSHIVYVDATAGCVPHWLPAHCAWAYITGAGQVASAGNGCDAIEPDCVCHLLDIRGGSMGGAPNMAGERRRQSPAQSAAGRRDQ